MGVSSQFPKECHCIDQASSAKLPISGKSISDLLIADQLLARSEKSAARPAHAFRQTQVMSLRPVFTERTLTYFSRGTPAHDAQTGLKTAPGSVSVKPPRGIGTVENGGRKVMLAKVSSRIVRIVVI
ncbi:hypothetical protein NADFUDRAFT_42868 [Nadsonia fulvescens var. elongata DSM 6958]|uniref:Uncharacterized protein n=1 Tax=Nadsonia fulvescens var. elongata DSM 6958 TaxID=857566 RepID=A0A1E3PI70_9ASCO|nr:hypothetical protein NADFUDRAFT_42868 [Nadsonia fulvescens var. elongata DSM 6958]